MPSTIYHLVPQSYHLAQKNKASYTPATFSEEGFIHCTANLDTLLEVANLFFADLPEALLVYIIDESKLSSPVKYEPPAPVIGAEESPHPTGDMLFPHVYGPLNWEAIESVMTLVRDKNGMWIR